MFSSPRHLRFALAGFMAIGVAIALNVLAQDQVTPASTRAIKDGPIQSRAALERNRRLALDAKEVQAVKEARIRTAAAPVPSTGLHGTQDLPQINRVGRLSPGFKLERPAAAFETTPDAIRLVQQRLAALGYFTARIDGRTGEETDRAIREYEMDSGLVPTGKVSAALIDRLSRSVGVAKPAAAIKPSNR